MSDAPDPLADARRAIDADRPDAAIAALRGLDGVEAAFLRARAALIDGRAGDAQAGFDAILAAAPKEPAVWMEAALAAHAAGAGPAFVKRAKGAGLPAPLVAMVQGAAAGKGARAQGTGAAGKRDLAALSAKVKARDLRGAETVAAPLLKAQAGAIVWAMLGQARLDAGKGPEAADAFARGLRLEPYAADLRLGLVRALARAGRMPQALAEARRAVQAAPGWADAQMAFGRLALAGDLAEPAFRAAEAARALAPKSDAPLRLAAEAALAMKRPDLALEPAAARKADAADRALLLGHVQASARDANAALATYGAALDRAPGDADLLAARGQLYQSLGRSDDAEADLRAAIAAHPAHGTALRALAYGGKLGADDAAIGAMRSAAKAEATPASDRRLALYALARATEPHAPDAAFAALARANAATADAFPHDAAADRAGLDRAFGRWPQLADLAPSDCEAAPIFVTGLPRSGTTLVEAILAAHPDVTAGGELGLLSHAIRPLVTRLDRGETPPPDMLGAIGADYDARVRRLTGASGRVTDKSIHSFVEIGLIRAILPRAAIVVVDRDPRDTALSIWRNHFPDGTHRYAASPEGIAAHAALFRAAVEGWRDRLPEGAFHTIRYEALLADPAAEARALLGACGLGWDDRVLGFHETAGRVDTLSFAQVRQPIYRTSEGGWARHEARIGPLLEALAREGLA
ncbi:tetratricopeptide repeat-containing sulfotransferase family protein [uncultured Jannaschia sp.]|uniref:tetratricopeptide repeat-containing sulfotransferase family protein n=1 Tax=uncultured Jannaschia sp. TaxID=293347 RepID=UPI002615E05B|nr:tetratricopeptide repeat-containing sulfotransferase family protein [uncultured Jannaschia sp.]